MKSDLEERTLNLRNFVPGSILTLSLLIGAGALATHARDNQGGGKDVPLTSQSVARVDMESVYDASDAPELDERKATETGRTLLEQLNRISSMQNLERPELIEYVGIVTAAKPTQAQQDREKALKTLSDSRAQELAALSTKNAPNDADKKRMHELQAETTLLQSLMPNIQNSLEDDRRAQIAAFHREQMVRLRGVVAKVAQAHGILHVFDANTLVFSVNDLTAEVIQKVGKHGK